jgi:hypothetical protein
VTETTATCRGGHNLGHDVPVTLAEDGAAYLGPANIQLRGELRVLAEHRYAIVESAEDRVSHAELVEVDGELRVRVVEELADEVIPEGTIRRKAISHLATLWIDAGAKAPTRIHRTVVTPGPPAPVDASSWAVREVLRPDLESAEVERQAALAPRRAALRRLRALQERRALAASRDDVIDILAALHGISMPPKEPK